MKKQLITSFIVAVALVALGLFVASCAAPATSAPATSAPELTGDPIRGGTLYDEWWAATGVDAPAGDQPLWKTQTTNTRSGADTWRCKECHGWDYKGVDGAYGSGSHMTGFPGIWGSKDKSAADVLATLKGGTTPDHDFSTVMDEQALTDLALFITTSQIDTSPLVNADKTSTGDAAQGKTKFEEVCIFCHGPNGNAINFNNLEEPEFLAHVAGDNPWEFIHKVRFGQPGWPMPSSINNDWSEQDVANVLAYVQTLSTDAAVSGGGPLYDKWWEVVGAEAPTEDQPLWKTQTTNTLTGADTWRCKECHGWDYKGVDGVYGSGSHQTGFPGILSSSTISAEDLTAWLTGQKNADHDYSSVLGEAEIAALVKFIRNETYDSAAYINADKTVNGDPARGQIKFEKTCAACHGLDGKKINFGDAAEPEFIGTVATDNPWEFFHKDLFGQPGKPMPAGLGLGYTMEDIANLLAYVQTLPTK